jgi:hypothetical protein
VTGAAGAGVATRRAIHSNVQVDEVAGSGAKRAAARAVVERGA